MRVASLGMPPPTVSPNAGARYMQGQLDLVYRVKSIVMPN